MLLKPLLHIAIVIRKAIVADDLVVAVDSVVEALEESGDSKLVLIKKSLKLKYSVLAIQDEITLTNYCFYYHIIT